GLGERLDVLVKTNEPKLNRTINQFEEATRRLNLAVSDENLNNLNGTLKNLKVASDRFPGITTDTAAMIKEARGTIKDLDATVLRLDAVVTDLQKFSKPFSER